MNIFVEVLAALAIASLVLQVFLQTPCLLESGSRLKIDTFIFFSPRKRNKPHNCREKLKDVTLKFLKDSENTRYRKTNYRKTTSHF